MMLCAAMTGQVLSMSAAIPCYTGRAWVLTADLWSHDYTGIFMANSSYVVCQSVMTMQAVDVTAAGYACEVQGLQCLLAQQQC